MSMQSQHPRRTVGVAALSMLVVAAVVGTTQAGGKGKGGGGGGGGGGGDPPPPADPAITYYDWNTRDLMVMNADGSNATVVSPGPRFSTPPRFTADGQEVLFAEGINGQNGIWAVGIDGQGLRLVTPVFNQSPEILTQPTASVVSALDGVERIAFTDFDGSGGQMDVYVVGIDGTGLQRLLTTPARTEQYPAWSAAGDMISVDTGLGGIVILDLGLDAAGQLVVESEAPVTEVPGSPLEGSDATFSAWAHDQPWIAVTTITADSRGNPDLWLVDLRSPTTPLRLTNTRGAERWPGFSPDDASLVFSAVVKGSRGTVQINVDGSGYRVIRKNAGFPHRRAY